MNLDRIGALLEKLRNANEVEAAAAMDVADAKAKVVFHTRKLAAMQDRHAEASDACRAVCDELDDAVNQETMAPLLLTELHVDAG